MHHHQRYFVLGTMPLLVLCTVLFVGCPVVNPDQARLTLAFTAGEEESKADLDIADIQSLTITLTKIELQKTADTPGAQDGEAEKIIAFEGLVDVDLVELRQLSEILDSVEIPSGRYNKIRLEITNPRLVLVSDPETVITDIQLTANSRLFIDVVFVLPEAEDTLLLLDFGGVKLVETGQGKYVMTPHLGAQLQLVSADALVTGTIAAVDTGTDQLTLALTDGDIAVAYGDADIFLPADIDAPTGAEGDLAVGLSARIAGRLFIDGSVAAERIYLLE